MSTENRALLHGALIRHIRQFIAGTILFNQQVADRVGLHLTDMQCINVLDLLGPTTAGKLARQTGLTTGGATVMLDRLEKAGFVRREPNPDDRRSVLVRINPRKLGKIQAFYGEINQRMAVLMADTPVSQLATVVAFFARMNESRATDPPGVAPRRGRATR
jgi:MarR family transcriptional regulator, organic hydroperoxide resistance regulator